VARSFDKELLIKLLDENREDPIRHRLANLLEAMGIEDVALEVNADRGEFADIVSHSHRLVVETKTRDSVYPDNPGAKPNETQKTQIQRYLKYFANEMEQRRFFEKARNSAIEWRGFLTDGKMWWAYDWDAAADAVAERSPAYHLARRSNAAALSKWIQGHLTLEPGRLSLPGDLYNGLVEPFVEELVEIQEIAQGANSYETKWLLWKRILRSSGLLPDEKKTLQTMGLFRRHTALVALSRAVVSALEERAELPSPMEILGTGFAAWVIELDIGIKWVSKLIQEVSRYDWRGLERDALRVVYEKLIAPDIRHGFGEYYTPDWLAEAVCEEILDEEWIERAVLSAKKAAASGSSEIAGVGVLDPACGSGTFLFHAARRLLSARALKGLSAQETTDLIAQLVHGIDIHPVAVEMSRATLAAALPALPSGGANALLVHQGDSMKVRSRRDPLLTFGADGALSIQTPQGREVTFPVGVLDRRAFVEIVEDLVQEAATNSAAPPLEDRVARSFIDSRAWSAGFNEKTRRALGQTLVSLHTVCDEEGNHVWEWYIRNLAAPVKLERAKVDRIVANPPWVRFSAAGMSQERQLQMRAIADEHGVWTGGQTATRMDLAAIFLPEARERFLVPGAEGRAGGRSGWVLPAGALRASQWEGFRKAVRGWNAAWDLSKVQEPPFTGSPSCVLLSGSDPDAEIPQAEIWKTRKGRKISRNDPWRAVQQNRVRGQTPRAFPQQPSDYEERFFHQGATLTPSPLIVAGESRAVPGMSGIVEITCRRGSQVPWKAVEPLRGRVERRKLIPALFGENLFPFRVDGYRWVVIPTDRKGQVNPNSLPAHLGKFWSRAERVWGENRKTRSPESLLGRIDYQRKLSRQLPLDDSRAKRRVVYNTSGGDFLRAARLRDGEDRCMSNRLYHWMADSENEALFLIALLNADSLQNAYQSAKKSERDFHTHFWSAVPIPKYDAKQPAHRELAKAAREAERVAARVDLAPSGAEERIRGALRESGVMDRIDQAVRQILPHHA